MMKPVLSCLIVVMTLAAGTAHAEAVYDQKKGSDYNNAAPNEIMQLPKYCWSQYSKRFKGSKYTINKQLCGPMTNHFCQGVLRFNRSQNPMVDRMERRQLLSGSLQNFEYTMDGIKKFPSCNIRKHVVMMRKRAQIALTGMP